jgi:hypothetical protein
MVADFEIAPVAPTSARAGGLGSTRPADQSGGPLGQSRRFPYALVGASLAGGQHDPLLLIDPTTFSPATNTWLTDSAATHSSVWALVLGQAISNCVLDAASGAVATL